MAVRKILLLGDPRLYDQSDGIVDPLSEETVSLVADLDDTLADFRRRHGFGRGIAAPQIGVHRRVIFVRMADDSFRDPLINPRIIDMSEETMTYWDGCFSFPELLAQVTRFRRVTVAYQDSRGAEKTIEAEDDLAELIQHEIDHLDGILAVDRAESTRDLMFREEWLRQNKR